MLAAFSRELADHRVEVRRIMHEESEHVDRVLERLQSLVAQNEALRQENGRLEALVSGVVDHDDRPSVVNLIQTSKGSERPSLARSLLGPTTTAGWVVRLAGAGVAGIGAGLVLLIYLLLGK